RPPAASVRRRSPVAPWTTTLSGARCRSRKLRGGAPGASAIGPAPGSPAPGIDSAIADSAARSTNSRLDVIGSVNHHFAGRRTQGRQPGHLAVPLFSLHVLPGPPAPASERFEPEE